MAHKIGGCSSLAVSVSCVHKFLIYFSAPIVNSSSHLTQPQLPSSGPWLISAGKAVAIRRKWSYAAWLKDITWPYARPPRVCQKTLEVARDSHIVWIANDEWISSRSGRGAPLSASSLPPSVEGRFVWGRCDLVSWIETEQKGQVKYAFSNAGAGAISCILRTTTIGTSERLDEEWSFPLLL